MFAPEFASKACVSTNIGSFAAINSVTYECEAVIPGAVSQLFGFAGDLRRAKAACERLVLIAGEEFPAERRDLAVILLHCGFLPQVGLRRLCFLTAHRPTYTLDYVRC